jgi:hypothetical protein
MLNLEHATYMPLAMDATLIIANQAPQSLAMKTVDKLLLAAIDETLKQIFKEIGAEAIYEYLENHCHLNREEIGEKPKLFSIGLENLLGSAAPVIETIILKKVYSKVGMMYKETEDYTFSDYIRELWNKCSC